MEVYAFDRDKTVSASDGPIPIEWVKDLAERHEVWAIGNRRLTLEAGISGFAMLKTSLVRERLVLCPRERRLQLPEEIYPDASSYVVVDDEDLSNAPGWVHYFPEEFAKQGGDFEV